MFHVFVVVLEMSQCVPYVVCVYMQDQKKAVFRGLEIAADKDRIAKVWVCGSY